MPLRNHLMPLRNHRLSWDQRKTLHERLGARAAALREEIAAALHPRGAASAGLVEARERTDDDAVADAQAALDVAALERDAAELREIDAAFERLDAASFGTCTDCGAPIAWDRLLARPQVQRCTRCQAAAERGQPAPPRL